MQGRGLEWTDANGLSEDYLRWGCVLNRNGNRHVGTVSHLNQHPLYDAMRRLALRLVRIVRWEQITGYAVEDGKSILWVNPTRTYGDATFNVLAGIAPPPEAVSAIEPGETYVARSGSVTYNGTTYAEGTTFVGVLGVTDYTGPGGAHVLDGIRAEALPRSLSNEWVCGAWLHPYWHDPASPFHPDQYAKVFPWMDRCHLDSSELAYPAWNDYAKQSLRAHIARGMRPVLVPEGTTAERYTAGTNQYSGYLPGDTYASRMRSCRVHEPAIKLVSAVWDGSEVKLTFTDRFHHAPDAPASIDRDQATWDITALRAEDNYGRTTENALREYLHYAATGSHCQSNSGRGLRYGDVAADSYANVSDQISAWNVHGACLATLWFVALPPKIYADADSDPGAADTRLWQKLIFDAEVLTRIVSERFVDETSSINLNNCQPTTDPVSGLPWCAHEGKGLFEYTYPALHQEANGTNWMHWLPTSVRPEGGQGFGPLPATPPYAGVFNQLVRAIRKLVNLRVDLPMVFETRTKTYLATRNLSGAELDGTCAEPSCSINGQYAVSGGAVTANPVLSFDTDWQVGEPTASAWSWTGFSQANPCDGDTWYLQTQTQETEWRFGFANPVMINVVPEHWRDLIATRVRTLMCRVEYGLTHQKVSESAMPCGSTTHLCQFEVVMSSATATCLLSDSGTVVSGVPETGWYYQGWFAGFLECDGRSERYVDLIPVQFNGLPLYYLSVPTAAYAGN